MKKISPRVIERSLIYIRTLDQLLKEKQEFISSKKLAASTGLSDVNVRKDISNFARVGRPRIGYDVKKLKKLLEDFILCSNVINIVLFGVGNLGTAILKYPGFRREKLRIVAAFDKNRKKINKTINEVKVYPVSKAAEIVKKKHAAIGILAVPAVYSQDVADLMVKLGLKGILNFSPVALNVPGKVPVKNIDFSIEFLSLFCLACRVK